MDFKKNHYITSPPVWVVDLGILSFGKAYDLQMQINKLRQEDKIPDVLIFVEHPHTITAGSSTNKDSLVIPRSELIKLGIDYLKTDRGGDITYHGPGQIVGYPILDLTYHKQDLHWYLRTLEELMILTCDKLAVACTRKAGYTGVWVNENKIGAIGVKCKRWVTMHGFSFNVNLPLKYYNYIIPCGIRSLGVTSLQQILDEIIYIPQIKLSMVTIFEQLFNRNAEWKTYEEIFEML